MTDHAPGSPTVPRTPAPAGQVAHPSPHDQETVSNSGEGLSAASLFILPVVTFALIVTMWYAVGGF